MHTKTAAILAAAVTMGAAATAAAQSAPSCSFDAGTATVTVTVRGVDAEVRAAGSTGAIKLNGVACGAATVTTTDTIRINGGQFSDIVTLGGSFAPGLTPEQDGASEIEMVIALGAGSDLAKINLTSGAGRLVFAAGGVDVGEDGDADMTVVGSAQFEVYGRSGSDVIDASAYTVRGVRLFGEGGADRLVGSSFYDFLVGGDGDDTTFGGAGNDFIIDGPGDDVMRAGDGDDTFVSDTLDGSDQMYGSGGIDTVNYVLRANHITVVLNNGLADDGEAGESDLVEGVETAYGGNGGNLIVGTDDNNVLTGGQGADELYGGGGDDTLHSFAGPDILVGDAGDDRLFGARGADSLDGGGGADELHGGDAQDTITGGPGHDNVFGDAGDDTIYNAGDDTSDQVNCGGGVADDAEDDPLDTLTGCEL